MARERKERRAFSAMNPAITAARAMTTVGIIGEPPPGALTTVTCLSAPSLAAPASVVPIVDRPELDAVVVPHERVVDVVGRQDRVERAGHVTRVALPRERHVDRRLAEQLAGVRQRQQDLRVVRTRHLHELGRAGHDGEGAAGSDAHLDADDGAHDLRDGEGATRRRRAGVLEREASEVVTGDGIGGDVDRERHLLVAVRRDREGRRAGVHPAARLCDRIGAVGVHGARRLRRETVDRRDEDGEGGVRRVGDRHRIGERLAR
jgi:hypothetical protein